MLTDYNTVKSILSIPGNDLTLNTKIQILTVAASAAVTQYCKRSSFETTLYTWYPPEPRLGGEAIVLPETPVLCYVMQGTFTQGQATITGLSSTSNLIVGMTAVTCTSPNNQTTQPFPNAATISTIQASPAQVTMSGNATYSGTATFLFGCSVWFDPNGSFGTGTGTDTTGPFGSTTLLYPGIDFAVQRDRPDGTSGSGKLVRLNSVFGMFGMGGAWDPTGSAWGGLNARGTLTAPLKPLWPNWPPGSIQVMYAAGYGTGATAPDGLMPTNTTIPADLTAATTLLAAWMFRNADTGGMQYQNESFQGYSGSLASPIDALKTDAELGSIRQILSRYRRMSLF